MLAANGLAVIAEGARAEAGAEVDVVLLAMPHADGNVSGQR